jgi:hypothetical protein
MLTVSHSRVALHEELAALADAFFAAREPVAAVEAVEPVAPAAVACDGSKGWGTRYLGAAVAPVSTSHRLFCRNDGAMAWGCVKPALLRFESFEDGETVAERYRVAFPLLHFTVAPVDASGYLLSALS